MSQKRSWKYQCLWVLAALIATIGIILMFVETYSATIIDNSGWVLYLYVTFQTNLLVAIYLWLRTINLIKRRKWIEQLCHVIVVTNITVVMIVYWALLFPLNPTFKNSLNAVETIWVHCITPLVMISLFLFETYQKPVKYVLRTHDLWYTVIYPLVWMTMAIIVYFSADVAIYAFLNFRQKPLIAGLSIPAITCLFIMLGVCYFSFVRHGKVYRFFKKVFVSKNV